MPDTNYHLDPNTVSLQKYMDKMTKMQQDQDKSRQQQSEILQMHLAQMNVLLDQLIKVSGSGSTVAATKKLIPFQTGSQNVGQLLAPPNNPEDYPTRIDVYKINNNRTIPHMTLINDGPGDTFFISSYSNNQFNTREEQLHVNDQRELFNVYELRLRSTLPTTTIRLIEGIFRTGSSAPQTVANIEIRPSIQTNQTFKSFGITFDNQVPTITISSPTVQTLPVNYSFNPGDNPPLPPGATATLVDFTTGLPMPFLIPEGFSLAAFGVFTNFSTDMTFRSYLELIPGTGIFTLFNTFPFSSRGILIGPILNIGFFDTKFVFPSGSPPGGIRNLITITNDDPFNNAIGDMEFNAVLSRLT